MYVYDKGLQLKVELYRYGGRTITINVWLMGAEAIVHKCIYLLVNKVSHWYDFNIMFKKVVQSEIKEASMICLIQGYLGVI